MARNVWWRLSTAAVLLAGLTLVVLVRHEHGPELDLHNGLLVSTRTELRMCLEPGSSSVDEAGPSILAALERVRHHPQWTSAYRRAGFDPASTLDVGCPAPRLPRPGDPAPLAGPGLTIDPSPYRVWIYLLDDPTADELLGAAKPSGVASAELMGDRAGQFPVSTALLFRRAQLTDATALASGLEAALGLPDTAALASGLEAALGLPDTTALASGSKSVLDLPDDGMKKVGLDIQAAPARGTTLRASETVNIRSGPSVSDPVVGVAPAGETASSLGAESGDFIEVYHRNGRGWTHRAYWTVVAGLWVNGYQLTPQQEAAIRWIAANTLARVPGTLGEKLTITSRVAWWSLKEAALSQSLTGVHRYSNCQNTNYDPMHWCSNLNWQVGIGAVYMANAYSPYDRTAEIEALAQRLYPDRTVAQILDHTANYAGYADGTAGYHQILNSTGAFRTSWLLRNHGVGFAFNEPYMRSCLSGGDDWCYGTWQEAIRYAPHLNGILRSVGDLRGTLYAIRPL